jgi:hypothetical protein
MPTTSVVYTATTSSGSRLSITTKPSPTRWSPPSNSRTSRQSTARASSARSRSSRHSETGPRSCERSEGDDGLLLALDVVPLGGVDVDDRAVPRRNYGLAEAAFGRANLVEVGETEIAATIATAATSALPRKRWLADISVPPGDAAAQVNPEQGPAGRRHPITGHRLDGGASVR